MKESNALHFRVRVAVFDHTVRGALFFPHNSRALGLATEAHARLGDRYLRAALGNSQDKRQLQQTLSGRKSGLQRGPKAKLPRPTMAYSIFRDDCHLPAMIRLTDGYARRSKALSRLDDRGSDM